MKSRCAAHSTDAYAPRVRSEEHRTCEAKPIQRKNPFRPPIGWAATAISTQGHFRGGHSSPRIGRHLFSPLAPLLKHPPPLRALSLSPAPILSYSLYSSSNQRQPGHHMGNQGPEFHAPGQQWAWSSVFAFVGYMSLLAMCVSHVSVMHSSFLAPEWLQ